MAGTLAFGDESARAPAAPAVFSEAESLAARALWASMQSTGRVEEGPHKFSVRNGVAFLFPAHWPHPMGPRVPGTAAAPAHPVKFRVAPLPAAVRDVLAGYSVRSPGHVKRRSGHETEKSESAESGPDHKSRSAGESESPLITSPLEARTVAHEPPHAALTSMPVVPLTPVGSDLMKPLSKPLLKLLDEAAAEIQDNIATVDYNYAETIKTVCGKGKGVSGGSQKRRRSASQACGEDLSGSVGAGVAAAGGGGLETIDLDSDTDGNKENAAHSTNGALVQALQAPVAANGALVQAPCAGPHSGTEPQTIPGSLGATPTLGPSESIDAWVDRRIAEQASPMAEPLPDGQSGQGGEDFESSQSYSEDQFQHSRVSQQLLDDCATALKRAKVGRS